MKKSQILLTSIIIAAIIHITILTNWAFAVSPSVEECNMFEVTISCDLSGWMKLILGDITIAAGLALFLHYLAHRSNAKIEQNNQAIKNNSIAIQKILTEQQNTKLRRQTYVIQSFKNQFNVLLLCIGIINRFQNSENNYQKNSEHDTPKSVEIENILHRLRNTMNLSIDVIDPMLIDQIENFLILVEHKILQNYQNNKPLDYEYLKKNIIQLTKRLNDYSESDSVLK